MAAFTANRLPGIESEAERLGFATLGPLAVAYCQWLHAWEQQHPNAKIYFLARDMYLMRQVYALLYPQEQTAYLQVSRRSLCPLLLAQAPVGSAAGRSAAPIPYRCADRRLLRYRLPDGPARKIL